MSTDYEQREIDLQHTLTADGYKLTSTLVRDDFNGREGQSHFTVTIIRNGQSVTSDYSMGCAHRHYVDRRGRKKGPIKLFGSHQRMSLHEEAIQQSSAPNAPTLVDVVHCLVSDAQCVAHGETFEDFASDMGYDEDSRKAEAAYKACQATYFGLLRLGVNFEELAELFQDY